MSTAAPTAGEVIETLALSPHPEGGWFRETWRASTQRNGRSAGTAIYYLLEAGQRSHWHRVDADETWHWYLGAPLTLEIAPEAGTCVAHRLGPALAAGERPQATVPAGAWQSARTEGGFTLVGCTVSPGFEFAGFELAPPGWEPGA